LSRVRPALTLAFSVSAGLAVVAGRLHGTSYSHRSRAEVRLSRADAPATRVGRAAGTLAAQAVTVLGLRVTTR